MAKSETGTVRSKPTLRRKVSILSAYMCLSSSLFQVCYMCLSSSAYIYIYIYIYIYMSLFQCGFKGMSREGEEEEGFIDCL